MDAKQFLESRELPDYLKKMTAELDAVYAHGAAHPLLTKEMAELGLLFIHESPQEQQPNNFAYRKPVTYKSQRYNRIAELLGAGD
ncbi:hypothetical protein [Chitinophaga sp. Ak27]|nr:hypothetical protein [Chitinophaga sp. Ak27]NLU92549.1 hypothetical protein [Chitinophaga sp. Ak27]